MSTPKKNLNKEIIAAFSGQSSMVTTPKIYIEMTGSHSLAIVLNQCVFWSNKASSADGWFHKEYQEWFDEVHIPERTMRRRFDKLEQNGWITTKVKKVKGVNTKHIYTHVEKILESISNMLHVDCPDRPTCPEGVNDEQKPCTKIAPTGHFGRSEPATLSDSSIDTDEHLQKKLTNCQESSSSFIFSETLDPKILSQKLHRDTRTDEQFLNTVKFHVDHKSDKQYQHLQRVQAAIKLITRLKNENVIFITDFDKKEEPKKEKKPETREEYNARIARYMEENRTQKFR